MQSKKFATVKVKLEYSLQQNKTKKIKSRIFTHYRIVNKIVFDLDIVL